MTIHATSLFFINENDNRNNTINNVVADDDDVVDDDNDDAFVNLINTYNIIDMIINSNSERY